MSKSGAHSDKENSIYHSISVKFVTGRTGLQILNCMGNSNTGKEKYYEEEIYKRATIKYICLWVYMVVLQDPKL